MLKEPQKKACLMLLNGVRVQDVAREIGVHRCTVWRWTKRKDFKKEQTRLYRNYKRRLSRSVDRIVEHAMEEKWGKLEESMRKTDAFNAKRIENIGLNEILDSCLWVGSGKRRKR